MTAADLGLDLHAQWWAGAESGTLLIQLCGDCDRFQFYPRPLCRYCHSDQVVWSPASGVGTVESYTVVHRAAFPGVTVPYIVARVRLAEGPVMLTSLVGYEEQEPSCDDAVQLTWCLEQSSRLVPVFARSAT